MSAGHFVSQKKSLQNLIEFLMVLDLVVSELKDAWINHSLLAVN